MGSLPLLRLAMFPGRNRKAHNETVTLFPSTYALVLVFAISAPPHKGAQNDSKRFPYNRGACLGALGAIHFSSPIPLPRLAAAEGGGGSDSVVSIPCAVCARRAPMIVCLHEQGSRRLLPSSALRRKMLTAMLRVFESGSAAERLDAAREFLSRYPLVSKS